MSNYPDQRSLAEIQRDLQHTRAEMGETLDAIRSCLTPGALLDRTLDYMKQSGPSQFASNLGNTVTENPVPVSLIGVGIAWLMTAGSRHTSTSSRWTGDGGHRSRIAEAVSSAAEKAGQVMQSARDQVSEAGQRMSHTAGSATAKAGQVMHGTQERAGQMRFQARHQAARAKNTVDYLLTEQPLILGLLGVALGAALGAGLPPTRQEDEILGETRDEYVRRAREVGEEHVEKVRQVATAAAEGAEEQAEREGLTSENADFHTREVGEKMERVAQATRHAAKTEADKQSLTP